MKYYHCQLFQRRNTGESQSYAMTTPHLLLVQERERDSHHTCTFYGPSASWERAEGKRSQCPTISQFPNYNKICFSPRQTEAGGCVNVWKESFSMHGHSNPSHQTILNCSRSSLQSFCSLASLRAVTEGSRSGSVGQILPTCLQKKKATTQRKYSIPHICKRQNEKQ